MAKVAIPAAFNLDQVSRLTGLSRERLRRWSRSGFYVPTFAAADLYSFVDLVGLRTVAMLRDKHHVPLQQLRKVAPRLKQHHRTPWASLRFYVAGRELQFQAPDGVVESAKKSKQVVYTFDLRPVAAEIEAAARRLGQREKGQIGKVARTRGVMGGQNILAGTRIRTEAIWNFHAAGYSESDILAQYPSLSRQDIREALRFERRRRHAA